MDEYRKVMFNASTAKSCVGAACERFVTSSVEDGRPPTAASLAQFFNSLMSIDSQRPTTHYKNQCDEPNCSHPLRPLACVPPRSSLQKVPEIISRKFALNVTRQPTPRIYQCGHDNFFTGRTKSDGPH
jgi:hypothetical protein